MLKVKKGDTVKVLSGNDKGKTGEVLEVMPTVEKIIVKGINIKKKHMKPRRQGEEGGIISKEFPIHMSKVSVVCPKCGKAVRIGFEMDKDNKVRARPCVDMLHRGGFIIPVAQAESYFSPGPRRWRTALRHRRNIGTTRYHQA